MKKGIIYLIVATLLMGLMGCKSEKPKGGQETSGFDIKAANNIAERYMSYLVRQDVENSKKLYGKDLLKDSKESSPMELMVKGFKVTEVNEIGKAGQFKVRVSRVLEGKSVASLDEYTIKVEQEEGQYKISEINNMVDREAFQEGEGLRLRMKNNVKTNLIIDKEGIPQYTFSKDDKSNLYKMQVPREKFGATAFSYEGDTIAITTYSKDSYIGLVQIDETLAVQGGAENKGGGGGDQQQKQMPPTGGKEKPIGKEITSMDYIKDAKVTFMTFSLDAKFLVVQYNKEGKGKCLRVYKAENGEIIPVKFEETYPIDKVEVLFSSFDKQAMNYEIIAKGTPDKTVEGLIGKWQIDLKEFKIKKL